MYWLTENAFHPMMIGLLSAISFGIAWYFYGKRVLLFITLLIIALTIGIVVTEQMIVTDREQLTSDIFDVAEALERDDVDGVLAFISESNPALRQEVKDRMPLIEFEFVGISSLKEPEIDLESKPPVAKLKFVTRVDANAMRDPRFSAQGSGVSSVTLNYQKDNDGNWRITNYGYTRPQPSDFSW